MIDYSLVEKGLGVEYIFDPWENMIFLTKHCPGEFLLPDSVRVCRRFFCFGQVPRMEKMIVEAGLEIFDYRSN